MVSRGSQILIGVAAVLLLASLPGGVARIGAAAERNEYMVTALVSSYGAGTTGDPHLVNAWGLVSSATSPWWVNAADADKSLLYNGAGGKLSLEVSVAGGPTGIVFNGANAFPVGPTNTAARFIFATESGTVAGWAGALGTTAQVKVDNSETGASYKGLAIATTSAGPFLYAANFAQARVDVFDGSWASVTTSGGFSDSKLPADYAPFGIQTIGSRVFVTFAKQGEPEDGAFEEEKGQGLGIVDAFDTAGNLLVRVAQHGQLNAAWGLAMAPANFGRFSGDLLVGNFGDGEINAYEEMPNGHFEYRGVLRMGDGQPVVIDGLWALEFGMGGANNGPTNSLFFTAGPNEEEDGLFGMITAA